MKNESFLKNVFCRSGIALLFAALIMTSACMNKEKTENQSAGVEKNTVEAPDTAYTLVETMPVFNGGDTAILGYIARNTVYPEQAKLNMIQGKVIVKMVVRKDCSISDVTILKSVDPILDAEAIRVVKSLPKFEKPGYQGGKPVSVNFMLPITFTLK
jgi:TonB family protein